MLVASTGSKLLDITMHKATPPKELGPLQSVNSQNKKPFANRSLHHALDGDSDSALSSSGVTSTSVSAARIVSTVL